MRERQTRLTSTPASLKRFRPFLAALDPTNPSDYSPVCAESTLMALQMMSLNRFIC